MVDLQIARQTPYSRDEIVFDYRLFRSGKEGYTRVMLVIAQTSLVRQKYRFLEESGMSARLVSVTTDGWLAALESGAISVAPQGGGPVAFLDMDSESGDLMVLNNGVPLFSRSMPVGATQLMAEGDRQGEVCAQEIGRALEIFKNETPAVSVASLVLAGAAALVIDADALNELATRPLPAPLPPAVLTPHPAEAKMFVVCQLVRWVHIRW